MSWNRTLPPLQSKIAVRSAFRRDPEGLLALLGMMSHNVSGCDQFAAYFWADWAKVRLDLSANSPEVSGSGFAILAQRDHESSFVQGSIAAKGAQLVSVADRHELADSWRRMS
jgi:hypothetical protein